MSYSNCLDNIYNGKSAYDSNYIAVILLIY